MANTREMGQAPAPPPEDALLQHLSRGEELLAAGKVAEAQEALERAHRLEPRNEKGQNLLGLTYFKLGLFERAAELYEALVHDNPADATLRVNLGLVYLKTHVVERAVQQLEAATRLDPGHRKAHSYLGLALAQAGDYAQAREHFLAAGSEAMAERMQRAQAGEAAWRSAPTPPPVPAHGFAELEGSEVVREQGGEPLPEEPALALAPAEDGAVVPEEDWGAHFDAGRGGAAGESVAEGAQAAPPALEAVRAAAASEPVQPAGASGAQPSLSLATLAPAIALSAPVSHPFGPGRHCLTVSVRGELLTRLEGLLALRGQVGFEPEPKRFRGRATDRPFGEGSARMMRAQGTGVLFVEAQGRTFLALELGDEAAYFREAYVYAFEDRVMFENGRVPSEVGADLDLVHLRGPGHVLLALPGALRAVEVSSAEPVAVPAEHLVGWRGGVAPQLVAGPGAGQGAGAPAALVVELVGEGFALIALPVR